MSEHEFGQIHKNTKQCESFDTDSVWTQDPWPSKLFETHKGQIVSHCSGVLSRFKESGAGTDYEEMMDL